MGVCVSLFLFLVLLFESYVERPDIVSHLLIVGPVSSVTIGELQCVGKYRNVIKRRNLIFSNI